MCTFLSPVNDRLFVFKIYYLVEILAGNFELSNNRYKLDKIYFRIINILVIRVNINKNLRRGWDSNPR